MSDKNHASIQGSILHVSESAFWFGDRPRELSSEIGWISGHRLHCLATAPDVNKVHENFTLSGVRSDGKPSEEPWEAGDRQAKQLYAPYFGYQS